MTNVDTVERVKKDLNHKHELQMEFMKLLQMDQEIKYLAIIAGGTAIAILGKITSGDAEDQDYSDFWALIGEASKGVLAVSGVSGILAMFMGSKNQMELTGMTLTGVATAALLLKCANVSLKDLTSLAAVT